MSTTRDVSLQVGPHTHAHPSPTHRVSCANAPGSVASVLVVQCVAMLVSWISLEKLAAALTSVSWGTDTRRGPAAAAPASVWAATESPAKVRRATGVCFSYSEHVKEAKTILNSWIVLFNTTVCMPTLYDDVLYMTPRSRGGIYAGSSKLFNFSVDVEIKTLIYLDKFSGSKGADLMVLWCSCVHWNISSVLIKLCSFKLQVSLLQMQRFSCLDLRLRTAEVGPG